MPGLLDYAEEEDEDEEGAWGDAPWWWLAEKPGLAETKEDRLARQRLEERRQRELALLEEEAAAAEQRRLLEEAWERRRERREKYSIGWREEWAPTNSLLAEKFGCQPSSQGLYCLVAEGGGGDSGDGGSVRVAATTEPAASVCLEYLVLALRVGLDHGGAQPCFSLEDADGPKAHPMLRKLFEPLWLAGTSAGEVLFQSDYYLKELALGQLEQPVSGMRSCLEAREGEWSTAEWQGRLCFVVREAEVCQSRDDVLVPVVVMGVEAAEMVPGSGKDALSTRPDFPLVKYAEAFSSNFEAIAERQSVVRCLRELAKATVLAKFIIDRSLGFPETWLSLPCRSEPCLLQVPVLWAEPYGRRISVSAFAALPKGQELYGGVDLTLRPIPFTTPKLLDKVLSVSGVAGKTPPADEKVVEEGPPVLRYARTSRSWPLQKRRRSAIIARTRPDARWTRLLVDALRGSRRLPEGALEPGEEPTKAAGPESAFTQLSSTFRSGGPAMYAIFGGGEDMGNTRDAWRTLARFWPGLLHSLGPVTGALTFGFRSLTQLAALLVMPRMIAEPRRDSIVIGWSLGCVVADAVGAFLTASGRTPRLIVLLDGRVATPIPTRSTLRTLFTMTQGGPWAYSQQPLVARRDLMFVSSTVPRSRSVVRTVHLLSNMTRQSQFWTFFQSNDDVLDRAEVLLTLQESFYFPDTDHYIIGQESAWDIAALLRRELGDTRPPAEPGEGLE